MKRKRLITKIFEVKKNNLSKTIILKVVNIIKRENKYSILSKLNKELISEYLITARDQRNYFYLLYKKKIISLVIVYTLRTKMF